MLSLMQFWPKYAHLSIHELMHPDRWPQLEGCSITIASVLDWLIRDQQVIARPLPDSSPDTGHLSLDDSVDDTPTPWFEHPSDSGPVLPEADPSACIVVLYHEFADPITVSISHLGTVHEFVQAHSKLVGDLQVTTIVNQHGVSLSPTHVMQPGQVICIRCEDTPAPDSPGLLPAHDSANVHGPSEPMELTDVSPTLPWSQPVVELEIPVVSDLDRQSPQPSSGMSVLSAAPFLGLQTDQLIRLQVPMVVQDTHVLSLRNQGLQCQERLQILANQSCAVSDDELRFHLSKLIQTYDDFQTSHGHAEVKPCFVVDPLLSTGWLHHGLQDCQAWGASHCELKAQESMIITVSLLGGHWVPIVMIPQGDLLRTCTWDAPHHDHSCINQMCASIAESLGYAKVVVERHHRMFFSSDRCGALAMAFLSYSLMRTMLPTTPEEAESIHNHLRSVYSTFVSQSRVSSRPWIWGLGDEPHAVSDLPSSCASCSVSPSHICITRDLRLDLLRDHGTEWGDDEIRYHINNMLAHRDNVVHDPS